MLECSVFFWQDDLSFDVVWDVVVQGLEMKTEPGATDPGDPTDPLVREALGEEQVHFGGFFRRNAVPGRVKGELVTTHRHK